MSKSEKELREEETAEFQVGKHRIRMKTSDPGEMKIHQEKALAMRIAQTHIEIQRIKADPKKACDIADEFLAWLRKKDDQN